MATTNKMIVAIACQENNITEPVATYEQWKYQGFQVKRGMKALFQTTIWKPCKVKRKDNDGNVTSDQKLLLVKASFFGLSQVERMQVQTAQA